MGRLPQFRTKRAELQWVALDRALYRALNKELARCEALSFWLGLMTDLFANLCLTAAQRSSEFEAARAVSEDFARQLAAADMFRMFAPHAMGGTQMPLPEGLQRLQTLARYDAASAWICMIGATTSQLAAHLPQAVGESIFSGPHPICCGIFAPSGVAYPSDDGYRISGRWAWASGSANADWILLGVMLAASKSAAPDPAAIRFAAIPRDALQFHDTWHSLGLRATSSGDVSVDEVWIPADQMCNLSQGPRIDEPLYRLPYFGFLALGVAACALGNAAASLEDFQQLAQTKVPRAARRPLIEQSRVQARFAEAMGCYRAAEAFYYRAIDEIWHVACAEGQPSPEMRANIRLAASHAMRQSLDVVRAVHDLAGGSAVYMTNPIQRRLRDGETMSQHMITASATYEMIGRVLFGDYQAHMQL